MRVPVGIVDDDRVGCGQVDSKTTSPGGQQEGKLHSTRSWKRTQNITTQIESANVPLNEDLVLAELYGDW